MNNTAFKVVGTKVIETPEGNLARPDDAYRIASENAIAMNLYDSFIAIEGQFYALLCPDKLSINNGRVVTEGGMLVIRAALETNHLGEKFFSLLPIENPFYYPTGQQWVAEGHLQLLQGLLKRAARVGLEEALAEQRPRWIGGGNYCRWDVPFSARPYQGSLIPPSDYVRS